MIGADYPLLRYERLVQDWRELGYPDDILDKVFVGNAQALFAELEPARR